MTARLEQRSSKNSRQRLRQLALLAAGRCVTCGQEKEPKRKHRHHCGPCAKRRYESDRVARDELVSEGLCEQCGVRREPVRKDHRRCVRCAADLVLATAISRAKGRAKCRQK